MVIVSIEIKENESGNFSFDFENAEFNDTTKNEEVIAKWLESSMEIILHHFEKDYNNYNSDEKASKVKDIEETIENNKIFLKKNKR